LNVLHTFRCGGWICLLATVTVSLTAPVRAAVNPAAGGEYNALEEVIVTARKVRENVRDIPLSIQVLTGEQLDELNLSRMFDLQYEVPGLVLNTFGMFGSGFALRGVVDQGGLHLNGVYLGSSHLAIARMFDLDRIEVLKGPQGTLYGRNSSGGSINFITRVPEGELGAEVEAAFGSYDTTRLQGHLNVPAGDAKIRIAFIGSDGDGYIHNSIDDRRFGEADYWGLRGSFAVEPNDNWSIDFTAQRVYDDGASAELWLPNPVNLPDPKDIHLTAVTLADPFLRMENDFASLTAEHDLGWAQVRSITGYAHSETYNNDDCAGNPARPGCIRSAMPLTYQQWSQELQIISTSSDRFDWLAGAYYFSGEEKLHYFQSVPQLDPLPLHDNFSTESDTTWALFSHAMVKLGRGWGVSAGLRYSHEEYAASVSGNGVDDRPEPVSDSDDSSRPSWRLDLQYQPRDGLLYYAGFSTGFESGGIVTSPQPDGELDRYDPEDLLSFEAGMKAQWPELGLTLDAAAFHYDFDNLQSSYSYELDGKVYFGTDNAAKAEVYGIDATVKLQATERLGLSAAMVWLPKREYLEYTVSLGGDDLSGNELPRAPEWSAVASLTYLQPVENHGELSVRVEYNYRSDYFYNRENVPLHAHDAYGLLNLLLRYEPARANWYAFATGRNLTDQDYFHQVFIQASPGYPDTYEVGIGVRF
jgi:iron complex outermembrane receptor protein